MVGIDSEDDEAFRAGSLGGRAGGSNADDEGLVGMGGGGDLPACLGKRLSAERDEESEGECCDEVGADEEPRASVSNRERRLVTLVCESPSSSSTASPGPAPMPWPGIGLGLVPGLVRGPNGGIASSFPLLSLCSCVVGFSYAALRTVALNRLGPIAPTGQCDPALFFCEIVGARFPRLDKAQAEMDN